MSLHSLLFGDRAASLSLTSETGWDGIFTTCGAGSSSSGIDVSPQRATGLSTYTACIRVISEGLIIAPLKVFRTRKGGGKDPVTDHNVSELLSSAPNDVETSVAFREDWVALALGWGHGYVRIDRDGLGQPVALVRLATDRVAAKRDASGPFFIHFLPGGGQEIIRAENMLDIYSVNGWSAACEGRDMLGIALAEQQYAGVFLSQASAPNGIITTQGKMEPGAKKKLQEEWQKMHGGPDGVGKIAIFSADMKYEAVSVDPATAQLLQSRQFSVEEICRWFGVNPRKVMDRSRAQGWSTLEFADTEHVRDTLSPWAIRMEAMMNLRLFTERERRAGFFVKHMFQGFLRGDMKSRVTFYRMLQLEGALTANEIREFEDMNPAPEGTGGDTHLLPLSIASMEDVTSGKARDKSGTPPGGGDRGGEGGDQNESGRDATSASVAMFAEALEPVFEAAFQRVIQREYSAVTRMAAKNEDADVRATVIQGFLDGEAVHLASALLPALIATGHEIGVCDAVVSKITQDYYGAAGAAYKKTDDAAVLAEVRLKEQPGTWASRVVAMLTGKDADNAA